MIPKDQMLEAIRYLPDDATIRDAIEHLEEIERTEQRVAEDNSHFNGMHAPAEPERRHQPMSRDQLAERIKALPDDATVDDAIKRLEFIKLIEKRIAYADAHPEESVPQAEVERRFEAGEALIQNPQRPRALTKDEFAEKIRDMPDGATIDDAIERLEVIRLIRVGIEAANEGKVITQDEVERRVAQWRA